MRRLPPLNGLRAFEASVRNASFTRAAQELLVTQGAISRHVSGLEEWLGVNLVQRTRRGIQPTPAGADLFGTLRSALDQIEITINRLNRPPNRKTLRLKLPPTFAIRWLIPRLARFHGLHPQFDVHITTTRQQPVDYNREDFDICIHSGIEPLPNVKRRPLFGEILMPVCSPNLLKQHPGLSHPNDLANHLLLCSFHRPDDWSTWLHAAGVDGVSGNKGLKFENSALAYQAAIDGLGVVMAQRAFVEEDLQTQRLVAPLSLRVPTEHSYHLAWPAEQQSEKLEAFEHWIVAEAKAMEEACGRIAPESA